MLPSSSSLLRQTALIVLLIARRTLSIPVDNNVEGEPEIECGPTSITINFNTRNPFQGHVFVKGLFDQDNCRNDEGGRQVAGIELAFDTCNVARTRSLNPKGVFVTTTVVISFHPQFVTKVDGAYRIQCFYMEADKTVSADIEVSDLTTALQTALVPMPVCKYEILAGGPTGEPVQFASVGQQVYHKWTCESETTDTFCAVVHSCTVDDGNGDRLMILNEDGCALDKFILNNLEYPQDLMAGQEAHVYKYADRNQLFYQCQISISVKEPHEECARPQCPEPTTFGAKKLSGENAAVESHPVEGEADSSTTTSSSSSSSSSYSPSNSSSPPSSPSRSSSSQSSQSSSSSSTSYSSTNSSRPRYARLREGGLVTTPAAEVEEPHAGSSAIFSTDEEAALAAEDVDLSRDHALRLLRKKRALKERRDGVKMLQLDESIGEEEKEETRIVPSDLDDKNDEHNIKKRYRREVAAWDGHTVDVRAELTALDYTDAELALADLLRARRAAKYAESQELVSLLSSPSTDICLSLYAVAALGALALALFSSSIAATVVIFRPRFRADDCGDA